ncbi:MAG: autotransporter domain-containing protein [Parachlamydiales bacterium]|nr:autotransporter domain-containing protein [Verrucomicrobiota bacterium]MBX3719603.1 autotransporter domain-containing protein [Candidatus Acheromyda pituitae]
MNKYALLTAPILSMGAAALFADAHNEHAMAERSFAQQSGGYVAAQNGQNGQSGQNGQKNGDGNAMPMRQVTPETEPKVTHWADPYITADFIYWKSYEDGLDYAITGVTPNTNNAHHGSVKEPEFEWEPGFKLGFGLKFRHDGWDLFAQWTWLNEVESHSHAHASTNSIIYGSWTPNLIADNGSFDHSAIITNSNGRAHAHWDMRFNALDLELGRNFYISRFLTLRPHFGFKFGWIDQDYHTKYHNLEGENGTEYNIKMSQDFFGVGLRAGLDAVWYFTKHWGLYGDIAAAALWSDFDNHRKDSFATAFVPKYHTMRNHNSFFTLTEVVEFGLGFRYDTTFFVGDYEFYLQAGWEEQIWFNQNQFYDLNNDMSGNLTFQGLTVKAGLMF